MTGPRERPESAVVLSGGGADGAYAVGVLKALCSGASASTGNRPLEPDVFAGTSSGAFNATYLAAAWKRYGTAAVSNLETVWLDRLGSKPDGTNGLYRLRVDPLSLADPRSYVPDPLRPLIDLLGDTTYLGWDGVQRLVHTVTSAEGSIRQRVIKSFNVESFISREPFERLIKEVIDFESLRQSGRYLSVIASNWVTGDLHVFRRSDLCSRVLGPQVVLASSAVPGLFPPTAIGAQLFVDGSVLLNTPLKPAIETGATELHVVYLDPDIKNIPLGSIRSTVETFYRMQQIAWASAMNDDIEDARSVNRGLDLLARIEAEEELTHPDADLFVRVGGRLLASGRRVSRYRPLIIHKYRPRDDTSGDLGFLNLVPERLERLIDRGFEDAAFHDCTQAGCVLPGVSRPVEADAFDLAVRGLAGRAGRVGS